MTNRAIDAGRAVGFLEEAVHAVHALGHREVSHFFDLVHGVYLAVTIKAGNIGLNMAFVIETDEIGEVVDFRPRNRLLFVPVFLQFFPLFFGFPLGFMAINTFLNTGDAGDASFVSPPVAEKTMDLIFACVQPVTKSNRLRGGIALGAVCGDQKECQEAYDRHTRNQCRIESP